MRTHNKLKNTGIIFDLLSRQLTQDILSKKSSKAIVIIREYFSPDSELLKDLECYNLLTKTKYDNENKAELLINEVIKQRKKINLKKLDEEKYNLIKIIKENYDINTFFNYRLGNYKTLASIYRLFESRKLSPTDVVTAKFTILENICQKSVAKDVVVDAIQEEYAELDKTTRKLVFKLLCKNFNEKYGSLTKDQKNLLSEYVNSVSNSPALTEYVNIQIPKLKKSLLRLNKEVEDSVVQIKVNEVISRLDGLTKGGVANDEAILSMLRYFQLVSELKGTIKKRD
jgi:hypothetical protein